MESIDAMRDWWRDRFPVMDEQLGIEFRWRIDAIEREGMEERTAAYNEGYDEGFASADDWAAQHEDAMAEHGWVRLPVDADGVPIHVGDVMEWDNGTFTVHELKVTEDGWTTWDEQHGYTVHADECRHHRAPTVEDVLREFADEVRRCCDTADTVAEYAAKLRLAGDE